MEKKEIVKLLVSQELEEKNKEDLIDMLVDNPMAIDIDKQQKKELNLGDKMADGISAIAGSWIFIIVFMIFLVLWIILNTHILSKKIDPYPFILLNLVLSCIAAIQAPIIMMSQNRESRKDSLRNQNDYITDLKSELILEDLHHKMELILKNQSQLLDIYNKSIKSHEIGHKTINAKRNL